MSRKNAIILIVVFILLIGGGLLFFYFSSTNKTPVTQQQQQTTTQGNPFGTTPQNNNTNINTSTTSNNQTGGVTSNKVLAKLIKLFNSPTSGSVFFTNKGNQGVIRFVDRSNGNTYEYIPEMQTGEPKRLTNTTIPKIQEAIWSNTGDNLIYRYLDNETDNIVSFLAKLKISTSSIGVSGEVTGTFLSSNLKQIAINPRGDKIFSLIDKSDKSGTYGFTSSITNTDKKQIFDSPVSYWNISWPKESVITLTNKPSYTSAGFLYFFNPQTYSMDRILGDITGLSTVTNNNANLVAFSLSTNNSLTLDVYDVTNRIAKNYRLPTLADKCVWGNKNSSVLYCAIPENITPDKYPDAWYQGTESFKDGLWMIDTSKGVMTELYRLGLTENVDIDAMDLKISPDDQYITFVNKNDLSLWMITIQ